MNDTYGNSLRVTIFGASHGEYVGITASGLPAGLAIDTDKIKRNLARRASFPEISTPRREPDELIILGGVFRGRTDGGALSFALKNRDVKSSDYDAFRNRPRASHADYTAFVHNRGSGDYRGGGQASGRMTAPLVVLGAVLSDALSRRKIAIGTHIVQAGRVRLEGLREKSQAEIEETLSRLDQSDFPASSESAKQMIIEEIKSARQRSDSIGGILETCITGVPAGTGEPFFSSLESELSRLAFSVPAVKGIEFGDGFGFADKCGSEVMDEFSYDERGSIISLSNHNGGILGGMASGMPVIFRTVVKPTPTIAREMRTVDIESGENVRLTPFGRHDSAIFHRAAIVMSSVCAIALTDLLMARYGCLYLADGSKNE